jgi:hypothetical protein
MDEKLMNINLLDKSKIDDKIEEKINYNYNELFESQ